MACQRERSGVKVEGKKWRERRERVTHDKKDESYLECGGGLGRGGHGRGLPCDKKDESYLESRAGEAMAEVCHMTQKG